MNELYIYPFTILFLKNSTQKSQDAEKDVYIAAIVQSIPAHVFCLLRYLLCITMYVRRSQTSYNRPREMFDVCDLLTRYVFDTD